MLLNLTLDLSCLQEDKHKNSALKSFMSITEMTSSLYS